MSRPTLTVQARVLGRIICLIKAYTYVSRRAALCAKVASVATSSSDPSQSLPSPSTIAHTASSNAYYIIITCSLISCLSGPPHRRRCAVSTPSSRTQCRQQAALPRCPPLAPRHRSSLPSPTISTEMEISSFPLPLALMVAIGLIPPMILRPSAVFLSSSLPWSSSRISRPT